MSRNPDMSGRVCLITGANNGIGKETAVALARMGATVVMTSRDSVKGETALAELRSRADSKKVELMLADLLFPYELARPLEASGVTANALHPGVVRTGFGKNNPGLVRVAVNLFQFVGRPWLLSPEEGAQTSVYLASSLEVEGVTGKYF